MFNVSVKMPEADAILQAHGLQWGGPVHRKLTNDLMKFSEPYVPYSSSILKKSARVTAEGDAIIYDTPYAKYHWYGKLMVDSKTGKGCFVFTDPKTGNVVFYSRKGVKKVLTDTDMKYNNGPLRGPRWAERCWIDRKDEICKSLEEYAERNGR